VSRGSPRVWVTAERIRLRWWLLVGSLAVAVVLIVGRAVQLQALDGEHWARVADEQQRGRQPLPARRGGIYDRNGIPLALTHETFGVAIAPRELRDPKAAAERLSSVLGLSAAEARRATDRGRRWVVLPGRFTAEQRKALGGLKGVHFERKLERFYPQGDVGREVVGSVSGDDRPLGGIEQQFDELLRGTPGHSVVRREASGASQATISLPVILPTDGSDIVLTLDFRIQEIADGALNEALRSTGASGGDLLLVDPRRGDILAAVSRRAGISRSLAAITEPYEPGSTLKPFFVAGLLATERASLQDSVFAENGLWRDENGRAFRDVQRHGWLSLSDALRVSSNIALIKLVSGVPAGEQYRVLRDFGFGTATGIDYPAESAGRLRRPGQWSRLTSGSLAMGYEIAVTPLQLTMGYGALANRGVLMEPRLLREIRGPDGAVLARSQPQALRRAVPAEVARAVTEVLVDVVEEGTATRAALGTFEVAGKTGTARRTGPNGRYLAGSYTSSFVGYFPARDPQLVVFVKLDEPRGAYYGGITAAPVTRETLQGILSAHTRAFDGTALLTARRMPEPGTAEPLPAAAPRRPAPPLVSREGPYVFFLHDEPPLPDSVAYTRKVAVPTLQGLPLREAVRRAHSHGLRVRLSGTGTVDRTIPASGTRVVAGDTVLLVGRGE
jgi:cell division protein FtsI (penicillin-binding protein 3)